MKSNASIALVACLAVAAAARGETPSVKALLENAIAVHGGASALGRLPSLEMRGTVETLAGRGAGRRSDLVVRERSDGAYRREATFEFRGRKMTMPEFYDGHVVKRRFGGSWDDLPTDEAKEAAAHRISFLLAAAAEGADARVEGDDHAADVPCHRVSVADGRDRAILWLAKGDGRLVAIDYPATSAEGMGTRKDVRRKLVFRDHRKVGGLLLPFDVESSEDGTPESRTRWESVDVLQEFDGTWLKLPDPTRRFIPPEELSS